MRAVVYTRYGGPEVLRMTELPTPEPKDDEVLVRVHAVSLNLSDWEVLRGVPLYSRLNGPFRPRRKVLGSDIAGTVVSTGRDVTRFQPGDNVYADILGPLGGFAEQVAVAEKLLAPMPDGMSHQQAAALPQAGAIAWQGIVERGAVQPGQRVLVNGAGGGSGMLAIQLAKLHGAEVTGVDNAEKQDFMRSVGADRVLDYRREDYTRTGDRYDLILDLAGYRSVSDYRRALARGGRFFYVGGSIRTLLGVVLARRRASTTLGLLIVKLGVRHLGPLVELVRSGQVRLVIDRTFQLEEVPDALRYLGEGHAKGKVVVTVN